MSIQRTVTRHVGIGRDHVPRLRILDFRKGHLAAGSRDRSGADAGGDDVTRVGAAMHEIIRQLIISAETVIHDRKTPVGGKHAQTVRHIVQMQYRTGRPAPPRARAPQAPA